MTEYEKEIIMFLEIKGICKSFGKGESRIEVLKGLDLEIQKGEFCVLLGPSGSGKSTSAIALEQLLASEGYVCRILDGDNIRTGLNSNLGFSEEDRNENIRRIAEVCKLFTDTGIITIASFVSPTADLRRMARDIVGADDFFEVYMSTPLEECERRDVKGLYAKARRGEVKQFTGISAPFDVPEHADISIDTTNATPEETAREIFARISSKIAFGA